MHALILSLMLAAGGSGAAHHPGVRKDAQLVGPFAVTGGLVAGASVVRWVAPRESLLLAIHWTEAAAGIGTSMRYAVTVDGVSSCSLTVACDAAPLVSAECSAVVPEGSEVAVVVDADSCAVGNPAGSLMLVLK